jgi:NAD(P)-dependent dehydrogenase (short-subunit alcohol dehydrogenase family)
MLDINLRAPFRLMRALAPMLVAARGSIVNVSSVTGLRAFPGVLAYCVSKAGVDQLTRCAALEMAPHGVRVNAVNPGVVVTNLHRRSGVNGARRLMSSISSHPVSLVFSIVPVAMIPAAFTSVVTPPNASDARAATDAGASADVTSASATTQRPPAPSTA